MARLLERNDPGYIVDLSKVVNFLSLKLGSLCQLEDMVNAIEKPEEGEMFCMELAGLLRELCKISNKGLFQLTKCVTFHVHRLSL